MKVTNLISSMVERDKISISEYPDCVSINGQCFNKHDFSLLPLEFRTSTGGQVLSKLVRRGNPRNYVIWESYSIHNPEPECVDFIQDKYNSNVFYQIFKDYIYKFIIDEKQNIKIIQLNLWDIGYIRPIIKYIEQDEEYIYFLAEGYRKYGDSLYTHTVKDSDNNLITPTGVFRLGLYVCKINKNTNAITNFIIDKTGYIVNNFENGGHIQNINDAYKLYSDNNSIYFLVITSSMYNNAEQYAHVNNSSLPYYKIYRIDKNTNTIHYINGYQIQTLSQQCRCNPIRIKDNYYYIQYKYNQENPDASKYVIQKIELDTNIYHASFTELEFNNCTIPNQLLTYLYNGYPCLDVASFSLFKISDNYLVLATHQAGATPCAAGASFHGIYLIKVSDNQDTFTEVFNSKFGSRAYGVLQIDILTYVVVLDNGVNFYQVDIDNNQIKLIYQKIGNFYSVGLDQYKRIYFYTHSASMPKLEIATKNSLIDSFAEFEEENYIFYGEDIHTNLYYWGKNYLNKYESGKIKITLSSNCIFDENESNTIIVTTGLDKKNIPVTIKNAGDIFATTEVVEVK